MTTRKPEILTYFELKTEVTTGPELGQNWLQITQLKNIGKIDKEITQKIIRLGDEDQRELYNMLATKFIIKAQKPPMCSKCHQAIETINYLLIHEGCL